MTDPRSPRTGYKKDDETGLDLAEARMYQNKHGRFTAPDPLLASFSAVRPQSLNRYIYTENNPVNLVDPSGLKWCRSSDGFVNWSPGNCGDGQQVIDKTEGTLESAGCPVGVTTSCYTGGSIIYYNPNGTTSLVSGGRRLNPSNQTDEAEIARITGAVVQASQNEIATTEATEISSSPISTAITYRPLESMTREGFENGADSLQLTLGTCGFIFDGCDIADGVVSVIRGDFVGGVLSAPSAIPLLGIIPGTLKLGRTTANATELVSDSTKLRNGHLANKVHPRSGVPFDANGFPDFSKHLYQGGINDVIIKPTGRRNVEKAAANKAAGFASTPKGYVWHHHQDSGRMQLVEQEIHGLTGHTGGASRW